MKHQAVLAMLGAAVTMVGVVLAQSIQAPAKKMETLLTRHVTLPVLQEETTTSAFTKTLSAAKLPGGIFVATNCSEPQRYPLTPSDSSLRGALNSVVAADPRYTWQADDETINMLPYGVDQKFLSQRIARLDIRNASSLREAADVLLRTPEVKSAAVKYNLGENVQRGGIGYYQPQEETSGAKLSITVRQKNVTVRDALNAIVRAHGSAVWAYTERRCSTGNSFTIEFLVS